MTSPGRYDGPDDWLESLAERSADGDAEALAELVHDLRPQVATLCARMLPAALAERATGEAAAALAGEIPGFDGRCRFTTWLHAVVSTSARSTYRSRDAAGPTVQLLDALDALEERRPELVEPVVLRDLTGVEYAEIARLLEIPLGTVKSRIHQARKLLRAGAPATP